jgi:hypothetical protein
MTNLHDELSQLTATQPAQPGDRLAGVLGEARRVRRTRLAASALSVVALLGIGAAVVTVPGGREDGSRLAATPVTQWPDRSDERAVGYSQGAFDAWGSTLGAPVRWIYRSTLQMPDGTTHAVMVFVGERQGLRYVVTSTSDITKLDANGYIVDPQAGSWITEEIPLAGGPVRHVPVLLPAGEGWQVISIDPPTARSLSWRAPALPGAEAAGVAPNQVADRGGDSLSKRGVFRFHVGATPGLPTFTVSGDNGTLPAAPLLVGDQTTLGVPEQPVVSDGLRAGGGGILENHDGTWVSSVYFDARDRAVTALAARCYGGGTLHIVVRTSPGENVVQKTFGSGDVTCDGNSYDGAVSLASLPTTGAYAELSSDRVQGYYLLVH